MDDVSDSKSDVHILTDDIKNKYKPQIMGKDEVNPKDG